MVFLNLFEEQIDISTTGRATNFSILCIGIIIYIYDICENYIRFLQIYK